MPYQVDIPMIRCFHHTTPRSKISVVDENTAMNQREAKKNKTLNFVVGQVHEPAETKNAFTDATSATMMESAGGKPR